MERIVTSSEETRDSDFAHLKINKIKNILNLCAKGIDSIDEGFSKKLWYLERN
jgi:hypothetical protein